MKVSLYFSYRTSNTLTNTRGFTTCHAYSARAQEGAK